MARQHQRQLFDLGPLASLGPFVVLSEPNPEAELSALLASHFQDLVRAFALGLNADAL